MKKLLLIFAVIIFLILGLAIWQDRNDLPFINYQVISSQHDYEIRQYPELLVAQNEADTNKDYARNKGFSVLNQYVRGDNVSKEKISILLPVMQYQEGKVWLATFVLANKYLLSTLPKPNHPHVNLRTLPAKKYIVMRFTGVATEKHVERHLRAFTTYLNANHIKVTSGPVIAFYNPPWTLSFIRRNEIMYELAAT